MTIVILNYPTSEVFVHENVDDDFISDVFADDIESYLESIGYNVNDIHYMCGEDVEIKYES